MVSDFWGLTAQATKTAAHSNTQIILTHNLGFFHFAIFIMRPFVFPSPKARGIPAIIFLCVASLSNEAE